MPSTRWVSTRRSRFLSAESTDVKRKQPSHNLMDGPGSKKDRPTGGVYIHIPFCKVKCGYCDFYSVADREETMDRLVAAIVREIQMAATADRYWRIDTVFMGGGTPSLLSPSHLERLVTALNDALDLGAVTEFTIEANPGEAPADKLRDFRSLGINRLSMGFQSFQPDLLRFLGRIHDPQACFKTYDAARRAGFANVNADLMFNIPGQTLAMWRDDLATLTALQPEHISAYALTVERGTELYRRVSAGEVIMPAEELDYRLYACSRETLAEEGYAPYEISNYARPGQACRHNLHYWRIEPYLGFGPSAHSFDGVRRAWNVRNLDEYVRRMEEGRVPAAGSEILSDDQLYNEKLAFGLRLAAGISVTEALGHPSSLSFADQWRAELDKWSGKLVLEGERLRLNEEGVFLADTIAADLFRVQ